MTAVTISPKFQIVIPKEIRERLRLKPGQKLYILSLQGSLRLIVPQRLREMRGLAKGLRWEDEDRDHSERI
jgi:AbrB family looped-hinge helix DNA binding protein